MDAIDNTQLLPIVDFVTGRAAVLHADGSMDPVVVVQLDDMDGGRQWVAMSQDMAIGLAYTIFELSMMEGQVDASDE
jgi:hypothetical protein